MKYVILSVFFRDWLFALMKRMFFPAIAFAITFEWGNVCLEYPFPYSCGLVDNND